MIRSSTRRSTSATPRGRAVRLRRHPRLVITVNDGIPDPPTVGQILAWAWWDWHREDWSWQDANAVRAARRAALVGREAA